MDWKNWLKEKIADCIWDHVTSKKESDTSDKGRFGNLFDVIQNRHSENIILIRSEVHNFNTKSVLMVMPGEEAIFVNNGQIVKKFEAGRYILDTSNYPFLSDLVAYIAGDRIFSSDIYYVRKVISDPLDWGTSIQVRDPKQLISTRVMCRGVYRIQVIDSVSLLKYFIGNSRERLEQNELSQLLREEILQIIKEELAEYIFNSENEILGICRRQSYVADKIGKNIAAKYIEFGFQIVSFSISGLEILNEKNRKEIEEAYSKKRIQEIMESNNM